MLFDIILVSQELKLSQHISDLGWEIRVKKMMAEIFEQEVKEACIQKKKEEKKEGEGD